MRADAGVLWRLFAGRRRALGLGVLVSVAQAFVLLPIGLFVRRMFDRDIPGGETGGILATGLAILGLYVVAAVLSLVSTRLILVATTASTAGLRNAVLTRLHALPVSWHEARATAELQSEIVAQAERVEGLANPLVSLGSAAIVAPPLLVLAIVISPLLSAVLLVAVPVLTVVAVFMRRRVLTAVRAWHARFKQFGAHVELTLRTMALTRSRSADALELERGGALVDDLALTAREKNWRQNISSVTQGAVAAVAGALVLMVGGLAVARDDLALADLLAFYAIIGLLLRTIAGGSGASGQLIAGLESLRALYAIVDDPAAAPYADGGEARRPGVLALEDVDFGYGEQPVITGLSLAIEPGEHVALVGANGAGKSTVASLLLGLRRPWSGVVSSDGVPYDELDVTALRRDIGYVPQDPTLRPGTVAENIAFGRPDADGAEVDRVVRLAGVDAFAGSLERGLDTELGDDGTRLSGGERQRVAIARALVCRPHILILDEPTNHLDADAVAGLVAAIDSLEPAPAVLVITHDARLAEWASRVVTIEHGRIVTPAR